MLEKEIEYKLSQFFDQYFAEDVSSAKAVKSIRIEENKIKLEVTLGYPFKSIEKAYYEAIYNYLRTFIKDKTIDLSLNSQIESHISKSGTKKLPQVKNVIAVASGKGGVGKSTVALNLALALTQEGASTGLLDADIYGPSQPTMLGTAHLKPTIKDNFLYPILCHGIQTMSIGYLIPEDAAMMWRGPMLGKALQQLLYDTKWENLDYLIIDLPPGTGDVQLTLCQTAPLSGAVIVTTPQDIALIDVKRACEMFYKLQVPVLGVIENMSMYQCSACGHVEHIFDEGGAKKLASHYAMKLLGSIPLDKRIREMTDSGSQILTQNNHFGELFFDLARKMAATLAQQPKNYSNLFPKIVVDHTKENNT